jgi:hypothetical protein
MIIVIPFYIFVKCLNKKLTKKSSFEILKVMENQSQSKATSNPSAPKKLFIVFTVFVVLIITMGIFVFLKLGVGGKSCGGIAGKLCPAGYECQYEGNYPDAEGKCVKQ